MPKIKTKKAVAKRIKITGTGKFKYPKCNKQHLLGDKSPKRKRNLRKAGILDKTKVKTMRKLLPYAK